MKNKNLFFNMYNKKKYIIHFIGIGGVGMSGIAEYMLFLGYNITGSDISFNDRTDYLSSLGVKIYNNHSKKNVMNVNLVVYSSAISLFNEEIIYSKLLNIPVIPRILMLYELVRFYNVIVVMGSHGKTTTTSFIFDLFFFNGIKINCINGGNIKSINSYIYLSNSEYFLLELDESDGNFLYLNPSIVILNNIDSDHLNNYNNDINNLIYNFIKYLKKIPFYGYLICCIDDKNIKKILLNNVFNCNIVTYGFKKYSDFYIKNVIQDKNKCLFDLINNKNIYKKIEINLFGKHNILNCVASISLLSQFIYIDFYNLQKSLYAFKGVDKRSEVIGKFSFSFNNYVYNDLLFILDYGHHPTEINFTLDGIFKSWSNRRIVMIFQPHRYTRTNLLLNDFVNVLYKVDILLLLNIYSASEINNFNINSNILLNKIYDNYGNKNILLLNNKKELFYCLLNIILNKDILLFQGAGNINLIMFDFIFKYIK